MKINLLWFYGTNMVQIKDREHCLPFYSFAVFFNFLMYEK